ncbi:MAG TPA: hypothetical protein VNF06_01215 [Candidatus Aquilonibacter sp.]|nr:hypothetical protein [Candidatus Aquilonibacter sp.]
MRLQFTLFETLLSIQVILIFSLFFIIELNSYISNSNLVTSQLRGGAAIYDMYEQVEQNESFQHCILQNNVACIDPIISIYRSSFLLTNIGIETTKSTFGNFSVNSLLNCFAVTPNNISELVCISSGD